ncbi:hypothetical protein F0562_010142 [Nyssa sinensis]|uniref:Pectinesterase n=1 Tax=Nyssa sinensis TaxID=561372 RepID=A0A5J5A086_9ASTE|nr:hypothetical protein F0562_010142 [Nyssa sinensis]
MASSHQSLLDTPKNTTSSCRRVCLVLSLCAIILPTIFLGPHLIKANHSNLSISSHLCDQAYDPKLCISMISEAASNGGKQLNDINQLQNFLMKSVPYTVSAIEVARHTKNRINDQSEQVALTDCLELLNLSIDRVTGSAMALANSTTQSHADAHSWLSSVLTNHVTCLDGLQILGRSYMETQLQDLISRARVSLAILTRILASDEEMLRPMNGELPSWITREDRKLLESSPRDFKANVVVAQDRSGNYRTVGEAVASAPDKSKNRYVIYVKRGTYKENVEVGKKKKNVMIVGDGMNLTIITGSLNVVDGSTTFRSATLAAVGDGFIAQDIWIQNTAGPEKHQAVALRVGADQSVINRCRIDAYQDTLYTHSLRQFYRDCFITGTVDFIFGNAAVVFQNCKLIARKPMANQKNMVTAQGRIDPNQNTGTSIQNCDIIASPDLAPVQSSFPTYLGRPWKEYSRTVVMQSYISDHIHPAGWSEWSGDFALRTLYYGEYLNRGPGAGTSSRVNWAGYHVITSPDEAKKFTVAELIQGGTWLTSTGVAFTEGL